MKKTLSSYMSDFFRVSMIAACLAGLLSAAPAMARDSALTEELMTPAQMGFQMAATPQMERLAGFHNDLLMYIVVGISLFVLALLAVIVIRFNARANPKPSRVSHNVALEIVWTLIPVLILVIIVLPSFKLLFYLDRTQDPEMTLKVTGYQWYWGYEYPDHDGLSFESYMIEDEEIDEAKGQRRLLSTDNPVVLPVDTNIEIIITAADVLHAWAVPAFGVKKDAVPGRLNHSWVRIDKPGIYYGQCSELCGVRHSYMPIEVHAVSKEDFKKWLRKAKREFAAYEAQDGAQEGAQGGVQGGAHQGLDQAEAAAIALAGLENLKR